jgi:hypothetical protein
MVLLAPLAPAYFCFFRNSLIAFLINHEMERSSRRDSLASAFACSLQIRTAISLVFTCYTSYHSFIRVQPIIHSPSLAELNSFRSSLIIWWAAAR